MSDPDDEQIRALLADLGSGGEGAEPLPPEVSLRLDETLAGLLAERAPVRARPRWAPRLAVAAAAVVVLGAGGLVVADLGHSGQDSSGRATSGAADSAPASSSAPAQGQAQSKTQGQAQGQAPAQAPAQARALPRLTSAGFARDVTALLGSRSSLRTPLTGSTEGARTPAPAAVPACAGPALSDGATVTAVTLDSAPAALVVHPAKAGKRLVEAWSCDGTHRFASTTVAP